MAVKIASFTANAVHGYMDFDFDFGANPTIITGPNGRGKTTSLKLMQALVTPSLYDLLNIQFLDASVVLTEGARVIYVSAKKVKGTLYLSTSAVENSLVVQEGTLKEIESDEDPRRVTEAARFLRIKYSDHPTYKAISSLESPLFLGLDRRYGGFQEISFGGYQAFRAAPSRRVIKGSLGAGLAEMEALVRDAFRRVRQIKDQQSDRLRRKLLLTGFRYEEVSSFDLNEFASEQFSESSLREQREEIVDALVAVGIDYSDARKEVDPFFKRVLRLSARVADARGDWSRISSSGATLEILLNQASLRRLRELVRVVREFNTKSAGLLQRFQSFVSCLNRFFVDSGKRVEIDAVGAIKIYRPDETEVPIDALSSGERQLLVMFGHVFFSSFGNKSNAFVIDEPELSLHLRWQEILLEEMLESSSRAQIIVATHSPEIVGEFIENCVSV